MQPEALAQSVLALTKPCISPRPEGGPTSPGLFDLGIEALVYFWPDALKGDTQSGGIGIPVSVVDAHSSANDRHQLRCQLDENLVALKGPAERPTWQTAGEHLKDDEPRREHV